MRNEARCHSDPCYYRPILDNRFESRPVPSKSGSYLPKQRVNDVSDTETKSKSRVLLLFATRDQLLHRIHQSLSLRLSQPSHDPLRKNPTCRCLPPLCIQHHTIYLLSGLTIRMLFLPHNSLPTIGQPDGSLDYKFVGIIELWNLPDRCPARGSRLISRLNLCRFGAINWRPLWSSLDRTSMSLHVS
jgi:hypothetical protein